MAKEKNKKVTIREISEKLGLSISTVSRALRDLPDINPQTRVDVLSLASKMNYSPANISLGLVKKQKHNIGVIIPGFVIPFFASALSGIQNSASNSGYNMIICQSEESYETEVSNVKALVKSNIDGLIVSVSRETRNLEHFRQLIREKIPIVFFDRVPENLNAPSVQVDDCAGAYNATKHLIDQGCKRIAHIAGPQNITVSRERLRGYSEALRDHNLPLEKKLILEGDFTFGNGMECANHLHQSGKMPDGLFTVCDAEAFGAMVILKDLGYNIPDDIAIVGFTDEPSAVISSPTLTSVSQPGFEIGRTAVDLLLHEIILGSTSHVPEKKILKTELIIRESSLRKKIRR